MLNLFGKSFFIHSVARESVLILIFDAHSFLPAHCVGFVLGFWFCWNRPTKFFFFSVLVVTDGDSEIVSFFGRASFVLLYHSLFSISASNITMQCTDVEQASFFSLCDVLLRLSVFSSLHFESGLP